jgi:malonyl-CoA/methylmalonyl-CoA synthetase
MQVGGYKISALEIESALSMHPHIQDVFVMGLPDSVYGQQIACVIVPKSARKAEWETEVKTWLAPKIAKYKIPRVVRVVDTVARSGVGKVNKKQLAIAVFGSNKI